MKDNLRRQMRFGSIAGVDKPVARLVMGSMLFFRLTRDEAFALLDDYFERGGNAIDTAFVYGGGHSDLLIGEWIRSRGVRSGIAVIAKGAAVSTCTPEMVSKELATSLSRLDIGPADLYLMHRDNLAVPAGEFVECLNEHVSAARIRAFGGSNWTPARLDEANRYAAEHGLAGFAASSPNFALAHWNEPMWADCVDATSDADRAWYERTRMPLLAWSSQASGFFTGRYSQADRDNPDARNVVRVWFSDQNFRRLERAEQAAKKRGVTAAQIALAYVLDQPMEIYALIGPVDRSELASSVPALAVSLTPQELRWLDQGA